MLKHQPPPARILDLGENNALAEHMRALGYEVTNTRGEDLNIYRIFSESYDIVTAFEILEHLVNPFPLLVDVPAPVLIATVPLRLWFKKSYRGKAHHCRDKHYHEFEAWQFDALVYKAGYRIRYSEKWTSPIKKIGIRPLLRLFYKRYYIIYATN